MTISVDKPLATIPHVLTHTPVGKLFNSFKFASDPLLFMKSLRQSYGDIVKMDGGILNYTRQSRICVEGLKICQ